MTNSTKPEPIQAGKFVSSFELFQLSSPADALHPYAFTAELIQDSSSDPLERATARWRLAALLHGAALLHDCAPSSMPAAEAIESLEQVLEHLEEEADTLSRDRERQPGIPLSMASAYRMEAAGVRFALECLKASAAAAGAGPRRLSVNLGPVSENAEVLQ